MAIENFFVNWFLDETPYVSVPQSNVVTVTQRPSTLGSYTGGIRKYFSSGYFVEYIMSFGVTFTYIENYCSSRIFYISRSGGSGHIASTLSVRVVDGYFRFKLENYFSWNSVSDEVSIPIGTIPRTFYFLVEKHNDVLDVSIYSDVNLQNFIAKLSVERQGYSNYSEDFLWLVTATYTEPSAEISFSLFDLDILRASSSSSCSSSSSSKSSSSSSSFSVQALAYLNDIGFKDGSYSSSSSSVGLICDDYTSNERFYCQYYGSWVDQNTRWQSNPQNLYKTIMLQPRYLLQNAVTQSYMNVSYWSVTKGSYDAQNSRYVSALDDDYYMLHLQFIGSQFSLYQARFLLGFLQQQFSYTFITTQILNNNYPIFSSTKNSYPQGDWIEADISSGSVFTTVTFLSPYQFFISEILLTTASGSSPWINSKRPKYINFRPYFKNLQSANLGYSFVTTPYREILSQSYTGNIVSSGSKIIGALRYYPSGYTINSLTFNCPDDDFYIDDLEFCGSMSSSSRSSSSSSRSSSSSSSSNGTEWKFFAKYPIKEDPKNAISLYINNHCYFNNTLQYLDSNKTDIIRYLEFYDNEWKNISTVYNIDDYNYDLHPAKGIIGYLPEGIVARFNNRPCFVLVYDDYNNSLQRVSRIDFCYLNSSNQWVKERRVLNTTENPNVYSRSYLSSVAISADGVYLALSYGQYLPYLHIFKRSGDTFTRLTVNAPDVPPTSSNYITCMEFSPDGNYLACGMYASPYLRIYKRVNDTFIKLTDPAGLSSSARCLNWSSDSNHLAFGHGSSPYMTMYSRSGDTFTKASNPTTLPSGSVSQILYSPDTNYLAVNFSSSPYFYLYSRSGSTYTKIANPPETMPSSYYWMSWNETGSYLIICRNATVYEEHIRIFNHSNGVLTVSNIPYSTLFDVKPRVGNSKYVVSAKVTSDGQLLICNMYGGFPPIVVYKINSGPTFQLISNLNDAFLLSAPITTSYPFPFAGYTLSSNGQYLVMIEDTYSNYLFIYKRDGDSYNLISTRGNSGIAETQFKPSIIFSRQDSQGYFHVILYEIGQCIHLIRDTVGNWSKEYILPTLQRGFWEFIYGSSNSHVPKCKIDSNDKIHIVYIRKSVDMPTVGGSFTTKVKYLYCTNKSGTWQQSTIMIINYTLYTDATMHPGLAVDSDGTVYAVFTDFANSRGVIAKLPAGSSTWQFGYITTNWSTYSAYCEIYIHGNYLYILNNISTFYRIRKSDLQIDYSYSMSQIQTDPYLPATYSGNTNGLDYFVNFNSIDLNVRYNLSSYLYGKIYKLPLEYSSSSKSSSSRSSSSSSSSFVNEPPDLWTYLTSGITASSEYLVDMIKDPLSNELHMCTREKWYKKTNVLNDDSWVVDDNANSFWIGTAPGCKMFISPSTEKRYIIDIYMGTSLYVLSRSKGTQSWQETTISTSLNNCYTADMVEDSSGALHLFHNDYVPSSNQYSFDPRVYRIRYYKNSSGTWVFQQNVLELSNVILQYDIYDLRAVIMPNDTIHIVALVSNLGVVHIYGSGSNWNSNVIVSHIVSFSDRSIVLQKDSNNHLHFAYQYSDFITYGYFNGTSWTIDYKLPGGSYGSSRKRIPGLVIDQQNRPHYYSRANNTYGYEMFKDSDGWKYLGTDSYTLSSVDSILGCFSNGYMHLIIRSGAGTVFHCRRQQTY